MLRRSGTEVKGIVGACSNVEISAGMDTRRVLGRWRSGSVNQELEDLTVGVYEARRLAIERLRSDARRVGASGVIGVNLSPSLATHEGDLREMHITVHLVATAVRKQHGTGIVPNAIIGSGTWR